MLFLAIAFKITELSISLGFKRFVSYIFLSLYMVWSFEKGFFLFHRFPKDLLTLVLLPVLVSIARTYKSNWEAFSLFPSLNYKNVKFTYASHTIGFTALGDGYNKMVSFSMGLVRGTQTLNHILRRSLGQWFLTFLDSGHLSITFENLEAPQLRSPLVLPQLISVALYVVLMLPLPQLQPSGTSPYILCTARMGRTAWQAWVLQLSACLCCSHCLFSCARNTWVSSTHATAPWLNTTVIKFS